MSDSSGGNIVGEWTRTGAEGKGFEIELEEVVADCVWTPRAEIVSVIGVMGKNMSLCTRGLGGGGTGRENWGWSRTGAGQLRGTR
jgi:hypothetical protein